MEKDPTVEQRIVEIAASQYGLITRAQLLGAGLAPGAVRWRVRVRRLQPLQRGVYRIGPLVHHRAREMAALLACGPGAVVSHWSAAVLWQIRPERGAAEPVDVTVPQHDRGRRPGIRVHRTRAVPSDEVTELDGIAVTVPSRTLLDLASAASLRELERAVAQAVRQDLTSSAELRALVDRYPGRPGTPAMRTLLEAGAGPVLIRSEAEERLLALIKKAELPHPEVNVTIESYEVDFLWRAQRIVVEVDGFAFHSSRTSFESDRRRDAILTAQGLRVMRVTWRQITHEPEALLVRLAQVLSTGMPDRLGR